jgi:transposase
MAKMAAEEKPRRARRAFTPEFKAGAVRLVLDEGKSIPAVAKDLDLTESALRGWVERARADRGKSKNGALTTEERAELARLRKENRELKLKYEVVKKAAALFAKENA